MKRLAVGAAGAVVVLIAAVLIYLNFIREDAPDEFVLTDQSQATDSPDDNTGSDADSSNSIAGDTDADTGVEASNDAAAESGEITLDGSWTVASGSEAGYRVVEDLRGLQDFEAVGRTGQVTGMVEIAATTINAASFEVDIASITSDDSRRDGQFTGPIMNAAEFPTATLTLTEPIELDRAPEAGSPVSATATGELTLRGVTNQVSFPVNAQILGSQIEIVAAIDVLFSDYEIDNPSNPFVTVRDAGKVEVQLLLDKL